MNIIFKIEIHLFPNENVITGVIQVVDGLQLLKTLGMMLIIFICYTIP